MSSLQQFCCICYKNQENEVVSVQFYRDNEQECIQQQNAIKCDQCEEGLYCVDCLSQVLQTSKKCSICKLYFVENADIIEDSSDMENSSEDNDFFDFDEYMGSLFDSLDISHVEQNDSNQIQISYTNPWTGNNVEIEAHISITMNRLFYNTRLEYNSVNMINYYQNIINSFQNIDQYNNIIYTTQMNSIQESEQSRFSSQLCALLMTISEQNLGDLIEPNPDSLEEIDNLVQSGMIWSQYNSEFKCLSSYNSAQLLIKCEMVGNNKFNITLNIGPNLNESTITLTNSDLDKFQQGIFEEEISVLTILFDQPAILFQQPNEEYKQQMKHESPLIRNMLPLLREFDIHYEFDQLTDFSQTAPIGQIIQLQMQYQQLQQFTTFIYHHIVDFFADDAILQQQVSVYHKTLLDQIATAIKLLCE